MRKIVFVIDSITCGGAERGLLALLKELDYTKYSVDLLYFCRENEYYRDQIPSLVNILEPDMMTELSLSSRKAVFKYMRRPKCWSVVFKRLLFGVMGKVNKKTYFKRRVKDWQRIRKYVPSLKGEYDVAIAFLEGNSVYYTLDKICAKRYILWQRTDYKLTGCCEAWDLPYFEKANTICVLSDLMKRNFVSVFPQVGSKVIVFPNIINIKEIIERSEEEVDFDDAYRGIRIISVGTLRHVKGYDISLKACKILRNSGYTFRWYVLGSGEEKERIQRLITKMGLQENFFLMGNKRNPYPYLARSDIFVQCSYREGYSTTVFEAKTLKKPIVITDAPGMSDQIANEVNGIVVSVGNEKEVASAIERLIESEELRERFSRRLEEHLEDCDNDTKAKIELFDQIT